MTNTSFNPLPAPLIECDTDHRSLEILKQITSLSPNLTAEQKDKFATKVMRILYSNPYPDRAEPTEQAAPLFAPTKKPRKFIKRDSEKLKRLVKADYERQVEQLKNNPNFKNSEIIKGLMEKYHLSKTTIYRYIKK